MESRPSRAAYMGPPPPRDYSYKTKKGPNGEIVTEMGEPASFYIFFIAFLTCKKQLRRRFERPPPNRYTYPGSERRPFDYNRRM